MQFRKKCPDKRKDGKTDNTVTDNNLVPSTANTNDGARLDVSARGFWITGQKVFSDVRVFDPNAS